MQASDLTAQSPGRLVPMVLRHRAEADASVVEVPTGAFVPNPLPPQLDWRAFKADLFDRFTEASDALGRVKGLMRGVTDARVLLRALWTREAKLSSRIENIYTTAEEMAMAAAGRDLPPDSPGREAWNYVRALEHGVASPLPYCSRLVCEMHELLMRDVRGGDKQPGRLRDIPVYIGDARRGPAAARFIPPPPGEHLTRAFEELERFANTDLPEIPLLARIAMMHYQFEAIHPFRDGNGRIGRVLIARSLCKEGGLPHPVVYVSAFIDRNKRRYYDLLLEVSTRGAWGEWIEYIMEAVTTQAIDAAARCERLLHLRSAYHAKLGAADARARVFQLVDHLFSTPLINPRDWMEIAGVSNQTARNDIDLLRKLKIVKELTGRGWGQDWAAHEILDVIEQDDLPPMAPTSHPPTAS